MYIMNMINLSTVTMTSTTQRKYMSKTAALNYSDLEKMGQVRMDTKTRVKLTNSTEGVAQIKCGVHQGRLITTAE